MLLLLWVQIKKAMYDIKLRDIKIDMGRDEFMIKKTLFIINIMLLFLIVFVNTSYASNLPDLKEELNINFKMSKKNVEQAGIQLKCYLVSKNGDYSYHSEGINALFGLPIIDNKVSFTFFDDHLYEVSATCHIDSIKKAMEDLQEKYGLAANILNIDKTTKLYMWNTGKDIVFKVWLDTKKSQRMYVSLSYAPLADLVVEMRKNAANNPSIYKNEPEGPFDLDWGMSLSQVLSKGYMLKRIVHSVENKYEESYSVQKAGLSVADVDFFQYSFSFWKDKLISVSGYGNKNSSIEDYRLLRDIFVKKYGEPDFEIIDKEIRWNGAKTKIQLNNYANNILGIIIYLDSYEINKLRSDSYKKK